MKTHPLLKWRIDHPVPIVDDIKPGDQVVLKTWERNPSYNADGHNPRIEKARTNYPWSRKHIEMLQRTPVTVLETILAPSEGPHSCVYIDLGKIGIPYPKDDRSKGKRWILMSDVEKA